MSAEIKEKKAWDKLPDEKTVWFLRFRAWLLMEGTRSVLGAYTAEREKNGTRKNKTINYIPEAWSNAKVKFRWIERAEAFDAEQRKKEDKAREEQEERERLERIAAQKHEEQEEQRLANVLRVKAEKILDLPEKQEVIKYNHDGAIIDYTLIPEFRAFQAANALLQTAKNHARAGLRMTDKVERIETTGKDGGPIETENKSVITITDEERFARLVGLAQSATKVGSS